MRVCKDKGKGKGELFKEAYDTARGRKLALVALRCICHSSHKMGGGGRERVENE